MSPSTRPTPVDVISKARDSPTARRTDMSSADDDESYVEASETDEDEAVVMSQRDVKAANIRAMMNGTLETCARPFVRGLTVEDPAVVLRRAFKSPFPNAPNRSGARR